MGAVGALAPTVFLPRPEIIHISVPLFSAPPRSCTYTCTHAIYSSSAPVFIRLQQETKSDKLVFDINDFSIGPEFGLVSEVGHKQFHFHSKSILGFAKFFMNCYW